MACSSNNAVLRIHLTGWWGLAAAIAYWRGVRLCQVLGKRDDRGAVQSESPAPASPATTTANKAQGTCNTI